MHKLYELRDMLCEELEEYGAKDKLDMSALEIVDKLAHAVKNIDKIIDMGEYSQRGDYSQRRDYSREYRRDYSRDYSPYDNRKRTSMRRSMGGDMVAELHELKADAPNEMIANEIDHLIHKIEKM